MRLQLRLDPTPDDKRQARDALLLCLAHETDRTPANQLMQSVYWLDPTVWDLRGMSSWRYPPTAELLTAARRNT